MEQIINELVVFFGVSGMPMTFMELIFWFVKLAFGCSLFRYVLYSMFWLTSQTSKGGRR